jgi:LEA14-like dessication related protein
MRTLLTATALASLVAIGACASANRQPSVPFYRPTVVLQNVKLNGVGVTGGSLEVTLNIYNPNDYRLGSPRIRYRLLVEDTKVADGEYDSDLVIPAEDSVGMRVPASFSYLRAGQAGRAIMGNGVVNYRVIGEIFVDTPYGRLRSPYDRTGSFSPITAAMKR